MKIPFIAPAAAAALLACGCFTLDSASIGEAGAALKIDSPDLDPVEHVVAGNRGLYLFNRWPLVCGSADPASRFPFALFSDTVNTPAVQNRVTSLAAKRGCELKEMNVFFDERVLLTVPGSSFPIPVPYVFTFRDVQYSALFVKPKTPRMTPEVKAKRRSLRNEMRKLLDEIPDGGRL